MPGRAVLIRLHCSFFVRVRSSPGGVTGIVGSADPQGVTEYHKMNHEGIEVAESGDNERRGKGNSAEGGNVTWMEDGVGRP